MHQTLLFYLLLGAAGEQVADCTSSEDHEVCASLNLVQISSERLISLHRRIGIDEELHTLAGPPEAFHVSVGEDIEAISDYNFQHQGKAITMKKGETGVVKKMNKNGESLVQFYQGSLVVEQWVPLRNMFHFKKFASGESVEDHEVESAFKAVAKLKMSKTTHEDNTTKKKADTPEKEADTPEQFLKRIDEDSATERDYYTTEKDLKTTKTDSLRRDLLVLGYPANLVDESLRRFSSMPACVDWLLVRTQKDHVGEKLARDDEDNTPEKEADTPEKILKTTDEEKKRAEAYAKHLAAAAAFHEKEEQTEAYAKHLAAAAAFHEKEEQTEEKKRAEAYAKHLAAAAAFHDKAESTEASALADTSDLDSGDEAIESSEVAEGDCSVFEDPHITVFDGKRISLAQFGQEMHSKMVEAQQLQSTEGSGVTIKERSGGGDKWFVKNEKVSIQARYKTDDKDAPEENLFVRSVAVGGDFMNGSILLVEPLNGNITFNGVPILTSQDSSFKEAGVIYAKRHKQSHLVEDMTKSNPGIDVMLPLGVKLTFNRQKKHINVNIRMPRLRSGQDGLCGNYNGDAEDDDLQMILIHRDPTVAPADSIIRREYQKRKGKM